MIDFEKILQELRDERERLERAIQVLQELARGKKRRGRPPKWPKEVQKKGDAKS